MEIAWSSGQRYSMILMNAEITMSSSGFACQADEGNLAARF